MQIDGFWLMLIARVICCSSFWMSGYTAVKTTAYTHCQNWQDGGGGGNKCSTTSAGLENKCV